MSQVDIQPAASADWEPVMTLLQAAGLPLDGVRENLGNFVVARQAEMLAGCAGVLSEIWLGQDRPGGGPGGGPGLGGIHRGLF